MIFKSYEDGHKLKISQDALSCIEQTRKNLFPKKPTEMGLLLGRLIKDCDDVVVDFATKMNWFELLLESIIRKIWKFDFPFRKHPHQKLVDQHHKKSEGTTNFLGYWVLQPRTSSVGYDLSVLEHYLKRAKIDKVDEYNTYLIIVDTNSIGVIEIYPNGRCSMLCDTQVFDYV